MKKDKYCDQCSINPVPSQTNTVNQNKTHINSPQRGHRPVRRAQLLCKYAVVYTSSIFPVPSSAMSFESQCSIRSSAASLDTDGGALALGVDLLLISIVGNISAVPGLPGVALLKGTSGRAGGSASCTSCTSCASCTGRSTSSTVGSSSRGVSRRDSALNVSVTVTMLE